MIRHKKWLISALVAVLALSLAACSGKNNAPEKTAPPANQADTDHAEPNRNDSETSMEAKQGKGVWVGLIDNHSAEIQVDGSPEAFQLNQDVQELAAGLKPEESVEFEYVEEKVEGDDSLIQKTITKLAKTGGENPSKSGSAGQASAGDLPAERTIEVELEGMKEGRTAKLVEGSDYALYAFDGFTFDAKENKLKMDYDNDYFVEIVKLPSDYSLDQITAEAKQEMAETGKVEERKGEQIHASMRDASLFLVAGGEKVTKEYILKEVDGQGYVFKINMPHGEASEGFGPLAFASLNTIVNR
ncbi:hypothetical protein LBW89_11315 [Paenibacillus sp. alder61]|uniref:Lipoprotein n=1 Tax=Paenibacillus faecis TaxID=862114 RepID=A0A5D0CST2_9BACL|nr:MULTISPECIES: hypothetical protein [Paenibacillus]MCA1293603.1 hypothetical protein [Paenibacillus sp. alder61]TYA12720.1 hypothetical protein FRY98_08380 [Paenibacillus faecis]